MCVRVFEIKFSTYTILTIAIVLKETNHSLNFCKKLSLNTWIVDFRVWRQKYHF